MAVLGSLENLDDALAFLHQRNIKPQRLVIADDTVDEEKLARYLDLAGRHGLTLGRLPPTIEFSRAILEKGQAVRSLALNDLLGRPQVVLEMGAIRKFIGSRRILITGAGGSIGSELVRQVSDLDPAEILLLDSSECNLYSIDMELSERHPKLKRTTALCDVRDRVGLNTWFSRHLPDVVFHAAALKHVPLVEEHLVEGIRTNILGTQNIADMCFEHGTGTMVLISTDKAVNPSSVMGATKRCAEAYCQALDTLGSGTRFVSVRFGNVLGSSGSVVPLFQRQIAAGGPVTVTHPDIERFFMTIPEAVALVLQASAFSNSDRGGRGLVYVLEMGKPVKIADLARKMILLSGKEPGKGIKIVYIGLRPGEKLAEQIVHPNEELQSTPVNGVSMLTPRTADLAILKNQLSEIGRAAESFNCERSLRLLKVIVPEYNEPPTTEPRRLPTLAGK